MKSDKKILITGASGLLGRYLVAELSRRHDVFAIGRNVSVNVSPQNFLTADLTDFDVTYQKITKLNPDIIIHCAAMSNVDECERNQEAAFRLNSLATRNIAVAAQRFDAVVLYISTDYVFNGRKDFVLKNRPGYSELDKPEPVNIYGLSKYWGEKYIRDLLSRFFIVRTSWLFGTGRENFVSEAMKKLSAGQKVIGVKDMVSVPTYAGDLARAIVELVGTSAYGIYHLTNGEPVSRYEFNVYLAKYLHVSQELVMSGSQNDLKLAAARPKFSAMDNYNWYLAGFTPLRSWKKALAAYLDESEKSDGSRRLDK